MRENWNKGGGGSTKHIMYEGGMIKMVSLNRRRERGDKEKREGFILILLVGIGKIDR